MLRFPSQGVRRDQSSYDMRFGTGFQEFRKVGLEGLLGDPISGPRRGWRHSARAAATGVAASQWAAE